MLLSGIEIKDKILNLLRKSGELKDIEFVNAFRISTVNSPVRSAVASVGLDGESIADEGKAKKKTACVLVSVLTPIKKEGEYCTQCLNSISGVICRELDGFTFEISIKPIKYLNTAAAFSGEIFITVTQLDGTGNNQEESAVLYINGEKQTAKSISVNIKPAYFALESYGENYPVFKCREKDSITITVEKSAPLEIAFDGAESMNITANGSEYAGCELVGSREKAYGNGCEYEYVFSAVDRRVTENE